MKKTIKKNIIWVFISLALVAAPFYAAATDRWNETADFSHDPKSDAAVFGSAEFKHSTPDSDMWEETPDISGDRQNNGALIDHALRHSDRIDEKMYLETPELS